MTQRVRSCSCTNKVDVQIVQRHNTIWIIMDDIAPHQQQHSEDGRSSHTAIFSEEWFSMRPTTRRRRVVDPPPFTYISEVVVSRRVTTSVQ